MESVKASRLMPGVTASTVRSPQGLIHPSRIQNMSPGQPQARQGTRRDPSEPWTEEQNPVRQPVLEQSAPHDANDSRKDTNVFQYFRDSRFTGDITQSIELKIRD